MREAYNARCTARKTVLTVLAFAFFLVPVLFLSAQDTTQGQTGAQAGSPSGTQSGSKEITIEELFLKSIEFQILREKAASDDLEIKLSALDDLEKRINSGVSGADASQVEFVLEYLAMEGSGKDLTGKWSPDQQFPRGPSARRKPSWPRWDRRIQERPRARAPDR